MNNLSLLILEDEIELLTYYYEQAGAFFGKIFVATTLAEAESIIEKEWIDGILLDNYLPDGRGINLLKKLNGGDYHYPSLVITVNPSQKVLLEAMNSFAYKVMSKTTAVKNIDKILKEFQLYVLKHKGDLKLRSRFELNSLTQTKLIKNFNLTSREVEVIKHSLVIDNNIELGQKLFISHATIKRHWQNIFNKTNLRSRKDLKEYISKSNLSSYALL